MRKILTNYIDKSEYPEFLTTASDQLEILESEPKITMEMLEQYMKDISIIYLYETTTLEQNTDIPNIITNIERELELFNELKEGLKEGITQRKLFVLVQQQEFRNKLDQYMKEPDDYYSEKKTEHRSLWNDINSVIKEFSSTHKKYLLKTKYARDILDYVTKNIQKKIIESLQIMADDHLKRFTEHFRIKFPEVKTYHDVPFGQISVMSGVYVFVGAALSGTAGFLFALACFVGGLGFLSLIAVFWLAVLRDDKEIEKEVALDIHRQFNKHYILNPLLEYAEHRLELLLLDYVNGLATKS